MARVLGESGEPTPTRRQKPQVPTRPVQRRHEVLVSSRPIPQRPNGSWRLRRSNAKLEVRTSTVETSTTLVLLVSSRLVPASLVETSTMLVSNPSDPTRPSRSLSHARLDFSTRVVVLHRSPRASPMVNTRATSVVVCREWRSGRATNRQSEWQAH